MGSGGGGAGRKTEGRVKLWQTKVHGAAVHVTVRASRREIESGCGCARINLNDFGISTLLGHEVENLVAQSNRNPKPLSSNQTANPEI